MDTDQPPKYLFRKWVGVVWMTLEVALLSGDIFGFTSIFKVLPKYGVYDNYCISATPTNSTMLPEKNCEGQSKKYQVGQKNFIPATLSLFDSQDALTLGIIFFNLPSMLIGALVDLFGPRLVKLIAV